MKICQSNWDTLREQIAERGLAHLVSHNGEEAVRIVEQESDTSEFDPLLSANFAIWNHALNAGGLYLLSADETGQPYCPLCELERHGGVAADWIAGASDDALNEARQRHLVPPVQ